jgi:hypothetical protein
MQHVHGSTIVCGPHQHRRVRMVRMFTNPMRKKIRNGIGVKKCTFRVSHNTKSVLLGCLIIPLKNI